MHAIKTIILCIFISFNVTQSYANEALSGGTLQAYWQPYWDGDNYIYRPDLHLRYITHRDDEQPRRIVDINTTASQAALVQFIQKNFDHIPDTFFKYKEGYTNQPGTAVVPRVRMYVECDSIYYEARG